MALVGQGRIGRSDYHQLGKGVHLPHPGDADRLLFELRFLVDDYGFLERTPEFNQRWESVRTSYESPALRIDASYTYRDGLDITLTYPSGSPRISVATLMSALREDQQQGDSLHAQASFLRAHLERLVGLPAEVVEDCGALRFYHAPEYRKGWGTTIQMAPNKIPSEHARLGRLRAYFT